MAIFKRLLQYLGIDHRRFQMSWVSASEADKWVRLIKEVVEEIKQAGPNKLGL
jgi:coenzyme F420-reducing hydrogenase delta subunit